MDKRDYLILESLQTDADKSISDVAAGVHLSSNACWRRIKHLEEEGIIRRRVALLDPIKLGVGTTVIVMLRASEHSEEWLGRFATEIAALPEVVEVYRLSGDIDYLLKLRVADIAHYDRVYKRLIGTVRLTDVSSSFVMEEIKYSTSVPLPLR
ncbi:Lrp/AsnC family transcriptional regulator [Novosphingobium sp. BL-52-GroH]|uniref:Lrp/AsnC family transcriptional regulator n=1 Tax=Novosphingobium sp. BL-52-GroH TaxID=3349877 RepID=UPI00384E8EC9